MIAGCGQNTATIFPHTENILLADWGFSEMQTLARGYRGLSLMVGLNSDRMFSAAVMVAGLLAGAFIGTMILGVAP